MNRLETLTRLASESVKRRPGVQDMRDCHNVCSALEYILNEEDCPAQQMRVQVLIIADADVCYCTDHSIVFAANRFILDPTFGQFRVKVPAVPDYIVLDAPDMLARNKNQTSKNDLSLQFTTFANFKVAYLPNSTTNFRERLQNLGVTPINIGAASPES